MSAWTRFWFAPGPASTLGACRALFFTGLFLWHFPYDYAPWGAYSTVLWMPIWLFERFHVPLLSSGALDVIQTVWKVSLVFAAIGLFTRAAMIVAFVFGTYLMGLPHNFGQTQHFDTLAVFVLGALAISHAGRSWSIDALVSAARRGSAERPADSGEYTWPIRFVWVAMALIFFAAGLSKLRVSGLEWVFSDNLAMLLRRQQYHISDGEPLTSWGLVVASYPWLSQGMAAVAVATETLFPLALFSRAARLVLVPAALAFLIGIRVLMGPTFELFLVCFVFWVPWHGVAAVVRARVGERYARTVISDSGVPGTRSAAVLARLDLLHQLRFAGAAADPATMPAPDGDLRRDGSYGGMQVVTRRGDVLRGFEAFRSLAWVIPLGWPMLPLLYLPGVPALARRVARAVSSRRTTSPYTLPVASPPAERRRT